MSELVLDRVTYSYPGAARPALRRRLAARRAGRVRRARRRLRARASRRCCAPRPGLVPHFHGGEFAGRLVAGGLDTREHGPGRAGRRRGLAVPGPGDAGRDGHGARRARVPAREPRLGRGRGRARGGGGRARARRRAACSTARRTSCPAASSSGSRSARRWPGGPRLLLLDEPTSQLDPVAGDELLGVLRRVNEEWGTAVVLAEHRLERCLAAADRVIALRGRRDRLRRRPPRLPRAGAARAADPGRAPVRRSPA